MRVNNEPVCVLRNRPYSESSLIVELFSRHFGRLRVIAKGARRKKSYRSGLLLPFKVLLAGWTGRGNLPVLTAVEQVRPGLRYSSDAISCGYYMNELIMRFVHLHDQHDRLYDYYLDSLYGLADESRLQFVLRIFEKRLLSEIGFGLILDRDVGSGMNVQADEYYVYLPDQGPVQTNSNQVDLGIRVSGAALLAFKKEMPLTTTMLAEIKLLMRHQIDRRLMGRRLNSRRVMIAQKQLLKNL